MASQLYPTAACLAAPGPRLAWGLGRLQWRSRYAFEPKCPFTPPSWEIIFGFPFRHAHGFSTLLHADRWIASFLCYVNPSTHAPRNASSLQIPAHADDKHFIHVYLPPCKDFFVHSGNTSILATRLKPRAQVMDVHDRTSQHFLHSSPILRGTLKGKDQTVIPNNRSVLHTDTPYQTNTPRTLNHSSTYH